MKHNIIKAVKVLLACALVFMVAAPLIVGVYDATKGNSVSAFDSTTGTKGSIEIFSGGNSSDLSVSDVPEVSANADGLLERSETNLEDAGSVRANVHIELPAGSSAFSQEVLREGFDGGVSCDNGGLSESGSSYLDDWYNGRADLDYLFEIGAAHLVYDFPDGSTVDFGNPYVLDWTDVDKPGDFDQVIASLEKSDSALFAPEKAYASPITWLGNKIMYLAGKAGAKWTNLKQLTVSTIAAGLTVLGMYFPAVAEMEAKIVSEYPAVVAALENPAVLTSEEDLAMMAGAACELGVQRGYTAIEIASKMPELVNEECNSIVATGEFVGGGSSNFITALYQVAMSNQLSADFIMANYDAFRAFAEWLGADLTSFDDAPVGEGDSIGVLSLNDLDVTLPSLSVGDFPGWHASHDMTNYIYLGESDGTHYCSNTTILSLLGNESDGYYIEPYGIDAGDSVYSLVYYPSPYSPRLASKFVEKEFAYSLFDDGIMIAPGADLVLRDFSDDKPLPKVENIVYDGATGSVNADFVHAVNADASDLVVIGQDAKYDDAGNITDYGNVTVPDVFAPNYTAPGSYGEALDQMNATATTENPAHADSPSFGQSDTTVKDWVDENQTPKPDPSDQTAQDGFKVEDLEKVFPFCIPWDLYYLLSMFAAEPVAPHIAWPFDFGDLGKFDLDIDLSEFESVAAVVRTCETVLFCVGLAFATRELVRG